MEEDNKISYITKKFSQDEFGITVTYKRFDDCNSGDYYYVIFMREHIIATGSGTSSLEGHELDIEHLLNQRLKTLEI